MPNRQYSATNYRYGFNGKEKDDEIAQGIYSAEYWEYDSRLGRRWNRDPVTYPWQSPYACFNNNPIYFADPLGLEGEGEGDKDKNAPKGSGKTKDDPIYTKGDIATNNQDLNEVVITPQDNTSVAKPNVVNPNVAPKTGPYKPTYIEMVANKLRRMDEFVQNHHMEYSRPPVKTDFWGFMSYGAGGDKNIHMVSPNASSWAEGNPGSSLLSLGKASMNWTYGGPTLDAYEKLDKVSNLLSGYNDFMDGTGLSDINNPDKNEPALTVPNNKTIQLQVIRVHYMINNANDSMVSSETGQNVYAPGDTLWKETTTQNSTGTKQTKIKTWKPRK